MNEVFEEKNEVIARVSPIVEKLIQGDSVFKELDKEEIIKLLSILLGENFSPEELRAMSDKNLTHRIKGVMAVEVMSGLVRNFTPEEMAEFNAAVSRKDWGASIFSIQK